MKNPEKDATGAIDADLPGLGQHYCLQVCLCAMVSINEDSNSNGQSQCARYFTTAASLNDHIKTKLHKKRYALEAAATLPC